MVHIVVKYVIFESVVMYGQNYQVLRTREKGGFCIPQIFKIFTIFPGSFRFLWYSLDFYSTPLIPRIFVSSLRLSRFSWYSQDSYRISRTGLPNPNFRNQGFQKKNQEFIRRKILLNQEKNQKVFFLIFKSYYIIPDI